MRVAQKFLFAKLKTSIDCLLGCPKSFFLVGVQVRRLGYPAVCKLRQEWKIVREDL